VHLLLIVDLPPSWVSLILNSPLSIQISDLQIYHAFDFDASHCGFTLHQRPDYQQDRPVWSFSSTHMQRQHLRIMLLATQLLWY
jgi:hypothetical protein